MKKRFHDQLSAPPPVAAKITKVAVAPVPAKPAAKASAKKS
jgi:hypothetical protein